MTTRKFKFVLATPLNILLRIDIDKAVFEIFYNLWLELSHPLDMKKRVFYLTKAFYTFLLHLNN